MYNNSDKSSSFTDLLLTQKCGQSNPWRSGHSSSWSMFFCTVSAQLSCSFCNIIQITGAHQLLCIPQVPRAIVNLVEVLNIVPLRELHADKSLGCPTWFVKSVPFFCLFLYNKQLKNNNKSCDIKLMCDLCFSIICPCILKPTEGSSELQKVNQFNTDYQVGRKEMFQICRNLIYL